MNQKRWIPLAAMAGLAALSLILRVWEEKLAYLPAGGYYTPWHPLSLAHAAVTLAAAVAAWRWSARLAAETGDQKDCTRLGGAGFLGLLFAAVLLGLGAGLLYRGLNYSTYEVPWLEKLLCIGGGLGFLALLAVAADSRWRPGGTVSRLAMALFAVFFCLWLLYHYRYHAANPARNAYLWETLALIAAAAGSSLYMAFYYAVAKARQCYGVLLFAMFSLLAALWDEKQLSLRLMLLGAALAMAVFASRCRAIPASSEREGGGEHEAP